VKQLLKTSLAVALVAAAASQAAAPPAGTDNTVTILDMAHTYWRWCKATRPMVVADTPAGDTALKTLDGSKISPADAARLASALPEAWTGVDIDDHAWPRTSGTLLGAAAFAGLDTGLVRLRAKFRVADPAAVTRMRLSIKYRGGVVVYLNGEEAARCGMPPGKLNAAGPAAAYPPEAWVDAKGKLLPEDNPYVLKKLPESERKDVRTRYARRDRTLGPVVLDPQKLRKGLNVLAIEVRRSDYHPAAAGFLKRKGRQQWLPCGLGELRLDAVGSGVTPNCGRPEGVQVWNMDRNDRIGGLEYGDPNEPLRPVELVAPRNGVAAGRVVVSSDKAMGAVKATAGPLKRVEAEGKIPAANVTVLYERRSLNPWFCRLTETPPEAVPPYAKPYRGDARRRPRG